uniref:Uncharacterized protein n=1 Tax=Anguilla anguilla TaxID=7936 RepID=A0A0E9TSA8_ANGAN
MLLRPRENAISFSRKVPGGLKTIAYIIYWEF